MRQVILGRLVLLIAVLIVWLPTATSQTVIRFWTAPNGSDTANCPAGSLTDPATYLTVGRAAECAVTSPWEIYLKGTLGTYTQTTHAINTSTRHATSFVSGISGTPNIIRGVPGEARPVLNFVAAGNGWVQLYHTGTPNPARNNITFKEFVYDGNNGPDQGVYLTGANLTVEDCEIRNTADFSIYPTPVVGPDGSKTFPSSATHIRRCELHHTVNSYAVYGFPRNSIFEDNVVHHVKNAGIQLQYDHTNTIVRNNRFYDIERRDLQENQCNGIYVAQKYIASGPDPAGATGVQIYNNIFDLRTCPAGALSSGLQISRAPGILIANNDFIGAKQYAIQFVFGSTANAAIYNSIFLQSTAQHIFVNTASNPPATGTTFTAAYNACESSGNCATSSNGVTTGKQVIATLADCTVSDSDFHLKTGTNPCFETGTDVSAITFDFARAARPQGSRFDIGAYERTVTPTTRYLDTTACTGNYSIANRNCTGTGSGLDSYTTWANIFAATLGGDTIDVRAGTWPDVDTNTMALPNGTSWTNAMTIKAHTGETVTTGFFNIAGETAEHKYVIIDGFVIDGGYVGVSIQGTNHHIRVQNSEIKNTTSNGVELFWGPTVATYNNELLNNHIHHIGTCLGVNCSAPYGTAGTGRAHGVYNTTNNNILRGNTFDHIGEYAIHQWTGGIPANNNIYDGNIISSSGQNTSRYGDPGGCCGGIFMCCGSASIATNNIVYSDRVLPTMINGINVGPTCINCKIYNNTTYNLRGYGYNGRGTTITLRNHLDSLSQYGIFTGLTGEQHIADHNMNGVNPLFVDAGAANFRLQSTSPARDQGALLTTDVPSDFYGVARPKGATHDIGAAEYDPGGSDTTAPGSPANFEVN